MTDEIKQKKGYGKCQDCIWHNQPPECACDVKRDSAICRLNKKPKKEEQKDE